MAVARILLLMAIAPTALAQAPPESRAFLSRDIFSLDLPGPMRLDLGFTSYSTIRPVPQYSVLTSLYWSREYYDVGKLHPGMPDPWVPLVQPYATEQLPGHSKLKLFQELGWPVSPTMTGLQFQQRNLLFEGDRLTLRGTGRHAQLVWQLGEATHEIEWRVTAQMERHDTPYINNPYQGTILSVQAIRCF